MGEIKVGDKVYTDADLTKPEIQKEISDLISKGLDYTQKTQNLAKERQEIDRLKKQFEDPSFQHAAALRDAIMERPEIAAEIDKIVRKYEDGDGNQPEAGSADDKAKNAELRKLEEKIDKLVREQESQKQASEQAKINEVYNRVYSEIDSHISKHELNGEKAKDVQDMVRTVAFRYVIEQGEAGTLTPDGLKTFIDNKVQLFQNPTLLKKAQARENEERVSGNAGGGAPPPAAPPPPKALPGDTNYRDRVKAALDKASKG